MEKETQGDLRNKPHTPKTPHPKTTSQAIIDLIVKRRKETGFGKRRLRWYIVSRDNLLIPESTIGKILKRKKLTRRKKRVWREYSRIKYQWDRILPFEQLEIDTKEIADKMTLPKEVYEYLLRSDFIPKWQWTIIDPVTRIRFLAWSYSRDWFWEVDEKKPHKLVNINYPGSLLAWSPDGTIPLTMGAAEAYIINVNIGDKILLDNDVTPHGLDVICEYVYRSSGWSPDSKKLPIGV